MGVPTAVEQKEVQQIEFNKYNARPSEYETKEKTIGKQLYFEFSLLENEAKSLK